MSPRIMNWVGKLALAAVAFLAPFASALAEEKRPVVYVAPIEGIIDLGLATCVQRVLDSDQRWLGEKGRASSALRQAGVAEIDGERVDVVSDGELIDAGQFVEVTRVDGNRIVVRRVPHITTERSNE